MLPKYSSCIVQVVVGKPLCVTPLLLQCVPRKRLHFASGIASLLLDSGCTAHSRFHIPLQINDTSVCNITRHSHSFALLQQAKIIIWDEVLMQHKYAIEAVDRTLQDLLGNPVPLVELLCCLVVTLGKHFQLFLMATGNRLWLPLSEEVHFGERCRCITC